MPVFRQMVSTWSPLAWMVQPECGSRTVAPNSQPSLARTSRLSLHQAVKRSLRSTKREGRGAGIVAAPSTGGASRGCQSSGSRWRRAFGWPPWRFVVSGRERVRSLPASRTQAQARRTGLLYLGLLTMPVELLDEFLNSGGRRGSAFNLQIEDEA